MFRLLVPELEDIEFVDLEDFSYTFYIITKSKKIIGLKVDPKNPLKFEVIFNKIFIGFIFKLLNLGCIGILVK